MANFTCFISISSLFKKLVLTSSGLYSIVAFVDFQRSPAASLSSQIFIRGLPGIPGRRWHALGVSTAEGLRYTNLVLFHAMALETDKVLFRFTWRMEDRFREQQFFGCDLIHSSWSIQVENA